MRHILATAAVAGLLAIASHAQGQTPGLAPPKIAITLDERQVIREIIKSLTLAPAAQDVDVSLGAVAPRGAHLQPIPAEIAAKVPQVRSHLFFIKEGKIAIVDPTDNRIADIID